MLLEVLNGTGIYSDQPALAWITTFGEQARLAMMDFGWQLHGYPCIPNASEVREEIEIDHLSMQVTLQTLLELRGQLLVTIRRCKEELLELDADVSLADEMLASVEKSMEEFVLRWPEFEARIRGAIVSAGKPKEVYSHNATRPLTNVEVAKYMGSPAARDRRRAGEWVKERKAEGLAFLPVEGSNLCRYRIEDFPPENQEKVRPRT